MKIAYYLPSLYAPGGLERIVTFKANYLAEHCEGYETFHTSADGYTAGHHTLNHTTGNEVYPLHRRRE